MSVSSQPRTYNGRPVLTTSQASARSGLRRNYITTLLQSGRIEGAKPWGHEWMIYEDSLMAFLSQPRTPGRKGIRGPRKKQFIEDGHVFLSVSLAQERHSYARDTLLRLARDGQVISKRRGRDWYIDEESLVAYKRSKHPNFIVDSTLTPSPALPAPQTPESASLSPAESAPELTEPQAKSSAPSVASAPEPASGPSSLPADTAEPPAELSAAPTSDEPSSTPEDEITPPSETANQPGESDA